MIEEQVNPDDATVLPFSKLWPLLVGACFGLLLRLVFFGKAGQAYAPMMASFIYPTPVLVGAVTVYLAERKKRRGWAYYFSAGFIANALFVAGTLVILIEGLICAIVILPLFGILGGFGGLAMGAICRWTNWPKHALYSVAAMPLLLGGLEQHLPLPERQHTVQLTRRIEASPAKVWAQLHNTRDIQPDEVDQAWMYRIGVPLPLSGVTQETADGGHERHVNMGKNIRFDQVATDWQPERHVRWIYRFKPDSFPPHALDDHVMIGGQYFDLLDTEYTLTPMGSATELTVSMRYRVSTQFNWYAEPVAKFLVGNLEQAFLSFYARRAETTQAGSLSKSSASASATSMPSTPALMMPPA